MARDDIPLIGTLISQGVVRLDIRLRRPFCSTCSWYPRCCGAERAPSPSPQRSSST